VFLESKSEAPNGSGEGEPPAAATLFGVHCPPATRESIVMDRFALSGLMFSFGPLFATVR